MSTLPSIFGQRVEHGLAHELVGVLELCLQRLGDIARIEARQDVDDVHAGDGILALDPADQLRDDARVGELADDAEQGRFFARVLVVGVVQHFPTH